MKTKKVNRYYCDFCKKANCSSGAMALHEKHCTLNPNRTCRMCKEPRNLPELVKLIPNAEPFHKNEGWGDTYKEPIQKVRDGCNGCPTCTFAVLRQSKVPIFSFDFDYKKEVEVWWSERSEEIREQEEYAAIYG